MLQPLGSHPRTSSVADAQHPTEAHEVEDTTHRGRQIRDPQSAALICERLANVEQQVHTGRVDDRQPSTIEDEWIDVQIRHQRVQIGSKSWGRLDVNVLTNQVAGDRHESSVPSFGEPVDVQQVAVAADFRT